MTASGALMLRNVENGVRKRGVMVIGVSGLSRRPVPSQCKNSRSGKYFP